MVVGPFAGPPNQHLSLVHLRYFRTTNCICVNLNSDIHNLFLIYRGLDLTPWVVSNTDERFVYDLIAVSNHMGHLGGGHYTAYALNHPTGRWYLFDDTSTREIDESRVVTESAYVLVYRRIPTSGQTMTNVSNVGSHAGLRVSESGIPIEEPSTCMGTHSSSVYINDDDLVNIE
ncbi:UCH-domain-containing protein [Fasciola gigantica]|uniref:ubiquitinyl hydrolase 1 n=1 Tax=Fasciola gigantica TaxID=46835 RepID=A0A504Y6W9_FASGI|nr:UCH-domain-containing protein [Fasciola gigantica]